MSTRTRTAAIVGAGPVGSLAAIALAKAGWHVNLYESRPDFRLPSSKHVTSQRSINLAISHRGLAALEVVDAGAAHHFLQSAIPMHGRMIHHSNGKLDSQLYDRFGQCINSIDRALLNEALLNQASKAANISLFFNHKVQSVDFDSKHITLRNSVSNETTSSHFDLCVGADGSYSLIRSQMMRVVRMDFQQEYIRDEYVELKMPAGRDNSGKPIFVIDPNHLHIWPRHSFMLIALPNKDKSFTCTLFAPSSELDRLNSADAILTWFKSNFPDALLHIGEKSLIHDLTHNPRSPLISTKSKPYHYKDRAILLGDAAHSMVPFYGQGLNCGLEDVRVLSSLLLEEGIEPTCSNLCAADSVDEHLARVLDRYSENRHQDLVAICDLAMDNYFEMRHAVVTPLYIIRKTLDTLLYSLTSRQFVSLPSLLPFLSRTQFRPEEPRGWLPLYTMVTFRPDISYATAKRKAVSQARILSLLGWVGFGLIGATSMWIASLVAGFGR